MGSEILAKRDFFGSMKDSGDSFGLQNNTGIFFGNVLFISSNLQLQDKFNLLLVWDSFGYAKKRRDFFG